MSLIITGKSPEIVNKEPNITDLEITFVTKSPLIGSGEVCWIESKKPHKAIEINS